MNKLHVALDVDGVCLDWFSIAKTWAFKNLGVVLQGFPTEHNLTNWLLRNGIDMGQSVFVEQVNLSDLFGKEGPRPGAQLGMARILATHEVSFVTAVPNSRDVYLKRFQNLERVFGVNVDNMRYGLLCTGSSDKQQVLEEIKPDVWVEDFVPAVYMGINAGVPHNFVMEMPTNEIDRYQPENRSLTWVDWNTLPDLIDNIAKCGD